MAWYSALLGGGKAPSVQSVDLGDPALKAVSSPLSSYLAQEVGKGTPTYSGEVAPSTDPNYTARYNEFLSMDANDFFSKNVQDPATVAFKRDFDAQNTEGYAGNLRGSGRYRNAEDAVNRFSTDLAGARAKFNIDLPEAQMKAAQDYYTQKASQDSAKYKAWWDSLPENNPVLKEAIAFLNSPTGNAKGFYTDQGQESGASGMLGLASSFLGSAAGQGAMASVGGALASIFSFL